MDLLIVLTYVVLVRIPLYSITDWHRSSISDSHPFDQPGT
ncbi:ISSfl2 ORF [Shigella sonnei]|uniref:ISSfl2 ORF n=1 Tax=Shigella sonnei TaxID=624 RepID=A0A2Y6DSZ5_SHISO|nr:ISSfl2 ORF [Shigella sonnei]CSE35601.1 ISSfl2 ORF [Shigella sonnei]CSE39738.1 ISSfl2 ORF [Shigella sonnei]CSE40480.1 ISSfl2 ORF [Shigella sonnei]CSE43460.1 ISSfl2 ORF [Shigella sonnei]